MAAIRRKQEKRGGIRKRWKLCAAFVAAVGVSGGNADARVSDAVCAPISDKAAFSRQVPQLYKNFQLMARLPLTGKTLHRRLQTSGGISICRTPSDDAQSFFDYKVWLDGKAGASAEFHEYFHAGQQVNGAWQTLETPQLATRDNVVVSMLVEATALSYQLVTEQEAKNRKLYLPKPKDKHYLVSDEADIRKTFQATYSAAIKNHGDETRALETAGQETVRYLLAGKNERWQEGYSHQAFEIARDAPSQVSGGDADYPVLRREIYRMAGYVSPKINLTPEEFLGADADQYIDHCFKEQFRIEGKKVSLSDPKPH